MGSTVMEPHKQSCKNVPKKRRSLRINMPDFGAFTSPQVETSGSTKSGAQTGERLIRSASPTTGVSARSPAGQLPPCPQSAPVQSKMSSGSPKTIFPYPARQNSPPKSPRRLSFSGIFRSSSSSTPASIKIFSRSRREMLQQELAGKVLEKAAQEEDRCKQRWRIITQRKPACPTW